MKSNDKKVIAAGYARASTPGQARSGESLPDQKKAIETYSTAHGWKLQKIYSDEG